MQSRICRSSYLNSCRIEGFALSVLIDFFAIVFNALKTSQGFAEMNAEIPLVSTNQVNPLYFVGITRFLDFLIFFSGTCFLVQLFEFMLPPVLFQSNLSNHITSNLILQA